MLLAAEDRKMQKINQLQKSYRHSQLVKNVIKLGPVLKKEDAKTAEQKHEKNKMEVPANQE